MSNSSGFYPRPVVDIAGAQVVSLAGGVLLTDTVRVLRLDQALSRGLGRWRPRWAVHDPGKVVLDLALTLALGGDCLADIAVLRAEPGLYGHVASDPTVSRTIDRPATDAAAALRAIHTARAAARARAWQLAGPHGPNSAANRVRPLIIDVDATLVTAHSDKQGAAPTFKRGFGHHPLWTFVGHGPGGSGEPLSVLLRPGNAGSNTAADHITVLREALRQLPGHRPGRRPGGKVLIRISALNGLSGQPPSRSARCWPTPPRASRAARSAASWRSSASPTLTRRTPSGTASATPCSCSSSRRPTASSRSSPRPWRRASTSTTPNRRQNLQDGLTERLSLMGLKVLDDGRVGKAGQKATTVDEAVRIAGRLKTELVRRGTHPEVIRYCEEELIRKSVFHAVFEAVKGLAARLRQLRGSTLDGSALVDHCFGAKGGGAPVAAITTQLDHAGVPAHHDHRPPSRCSTVRASTESQRSSSVFVPLSRRCPSRTR